MDSKIEETNTKQSAVNGVTAVRPSVQIRFSIWIRNDIILYDNM